ncbi:MAG: hypothetical protein MI867_15050, partial [Pseudomonadales bacterium]|nr:hypothetical protein [Pseudomonadales bacterium]
MCSVVSGQIKSFGDIARVYGAQKAKHPALIFENKVTTYAALNKQSNQVANGLLATVSDTQQQIVFLGKNSDCY